MRYVIRQIWRILPDIYAPFIDMQATDIAGFLLVGWSIDKAEQDCKDILLFQSYVRLAKYQDSIKPSITVEILLVFTIIKRI
jgi:hypothetical protein